MSIPAVLNDPETHISGSGTITVHGHTFSWQNFEHLYHKVDIPSFSDGRLNQYHMWATVTGYCTDYGLAVYAIVDSTGQIAFTATPQQIADALAQAIATGENVMIGEANGVSLWALFSNELQFVGPAGYFFITPPTVCGF
mgnify:CR=1 FL=1